MTIRKSTIEKALDRLDDIYEKSKMENVNFNNHQDSKVIFNGKEYDLTEFIKEQTDLWRKTWITGQLGLVISDLHDELDRH